MSHAGTWEEGSPSRQNSKCKGPRVGAPLMAQQRDWEGWSRETWGSQTMYDLEVMTRILPFFLSKKGRHQRVLVKERLHLTHLFKASLRLL